MIARSRSCARIGLVKPAPDGAGVAAIGVAQEFAPVYTRDQTHRADHGSVVLDSPRPDRRVTCYYF